MKVVGQIEKSFEKDTGSFKYWALQVNGQEYRAGKFAPRGISVGDWVEFEATAKQNGNFTNYTADYKTIRKSDPSAAGTANVEAPIGKAAPAKGGYSSTGNDERQEIISRQSAFNTGLTMANLLINAGAIAVPAKVKKEQLVEFYTSLVDSLATDFYHKSTGKTWKIEVSKEEEAVDDFSDDLPAGDAW